MSVGFKPDNPLFNREVKRDQEALEPLKVSTGVLLKRKREFLNRVVSFLSAKSSKGPYLEHQIVSELRGCAEVLRHCLLDNDFCPPCHGTGETQTIILGRPGKTIKECTRCSGSGLLFENKVYKEADLLDQGWNEIKRTIKDLIVYSSRKGSAYSRCAQEGQELLDQAEGIFI